MVYLKEFIKLDALYKILMSNTSHYWKYINLLAIIFNLKVVSNEGVILVAHCHHLFIWADVKAKGLTIVVPAFVSQRHLY
jgi:hypothetical protein